MFDGFWSGMFGGLFGPALATWLSRYRYWAVFVTATLGVHVIAFAVGAYEKGVAFAIQVMLEKTFTPVGILVPMGIGLLVVMVAFVGTLNNPGKGNAGQ